VQLAQDGSFPRVVFESLLDQIEKLTLERRKLIYGDEDDKKIDAIMQQKAEGKLIIIN
jgi:hypothetical protein